MRLPDINEILVATAYITAGVAKALIGFNPQVQVPQPTGLTPSKYCSVPSLGIYLTGTWYLQVNLRVPVHRRVPVLTRVPAGDVHGYLQVYPSNFHVNRNTYK